MSRYLDSPSCLEAAADRPRGTRSRTHALVLVGMLCAVIATFGLPLAVASASTTAPRMTATASAVAPRTSTFCTLAASETKSSSLSPTTLTPTSLQATYTKLKSEEGFILANSPSQLKGDFQALFTFLNKIIGELSAVKYNFEKLSTTQLKTFESGNTKQLQAAVKSIDAYLTNVCKIKVAA
jgi:hypothetical protein